MQSSISKIAASALLLFTAVQGHMIMKTPKPFGNPNNSPLSGVAEFPCKQPDFTVVNNNVMAIGDTQKLTFTGSAVHGGGSCQIALTSDLAPTQNTKWMVIKSIEGGCPARNVAGNLPDDPSGSGAGEYDFTIPEGIAPGQYVLSWSWLNKVGNRE